MKNGIFITEYRTIYWYIPKNGCTSLKAFCAELNGFRVPENLVSIHSLPFPYVPASAPERKKFKSFAIVRDPVDRLASCFRSKIYKDKRDNRYYSHGVSKHVFGAYPGVFNAGMDFESFVNEIVKIPHNKANEHFRQQVDLITYQGEDLPDLIMTMKELKEIPEMLYRYIGVDNSITIPTLNTSESAGETWVSEKTKKKIESYYEKDYEWLRKKKLLERF